MRAVGLHADVVVAISRAYRTTCTLVRSGNEAFVVDSPVFPDELEILPAIAEQAGFPVVGVLATHADWDHLLGALRVPGGAAGLRGDDRGAADRAGPARPSASCATSTTSSTSSARRRCRCRAPRRCRCPATAGSASASSSCTPPTATPRTGWRSGSRGRACWWPATTSRRSRSRCSPRPARRAPTWPRWTGSSRSSSRPTTSCPGHGEPIDGTRAAAILREDRAYVQALREHGAEAKLPLARRSGAQRKIHARRQRWRRRARADARAHAGAARARRGGAGRRARAPRQGPARARARAAAGRGRRAGRRVGHARGARARGGAAALPRRAAAADGRDRPPALLRLHPVRADRRLGATSSCCSAPARSTPAPGSRARAPCTPRTRRCAGSPTSPGCPRAPAAASSRAARNGNLSALHAAREHARHRARRRGAAALARRLQRGGPLVRARGRALMDVDVLPVRGRRARPPARRGAARGARRRRRRVRGRRHRRHDQRRAARRPRRRRRRVPRARRLAARRRRLRRGRAVRAERARALRRDRARRLADRRPAQVAVRAVRLVRAALPRARASAAPRTARAPPTSTRSTATRRPTTRPTTACTSRAARAAIPFWFSLAVHGTDAYAAAVERTLEVTREGAEEIRAPRRARAGRRAGAVDPRLPPPRLGRRGLPPLGGRAARGRHRVRVPDDRARRDRGAAGARQPAHDASRTCASCSTRCAR